MLVWALRAPAVHRPVLFDAFQLHNVHCDLAGQRIGHDLKKHGGLRAPLLDAESLITFMQHNRLAIALSHMHHIFQHLKLASI